MRVFLKVIAFLFLGGVGWVTYQISDRAHPVTDAKVIIAPFMIEPGGVLHVDVQVFYLKACTAYVKRVLYDAHGTKFVMQELLVPATTPGLQHSASIIPIPPNFAVGEGRYVSSPSYACNWFQRIFWPVSTPDRWASFNVSKAP